MNENPSPETHMRVPEGWALVPVKPTMDMVKNAAGDHEGESWLPHSLWASMLAEAPQAPETVGFYHATVEACARLIEDNIIMDTSAGKVLAPRQEGNRDGLHYAAAIRALTTEGQP